MTLSEDSNDYSSDSSKSGASNPVRRSKFEDEDEDEVLDSWDVASGSDEGNGKESLRPTVGQDTKPGNSKKTVAQKIKERRDAAALVQNDGTPEKDEDPSVIRARARQREQEADLAHAEDLIGAIGIGKARSDTSFIVQSDEQTQSGTVDLSKLPFFHPTTRSQFNLMRETLPPLILANAGQPHYPLFLHDLIRQLVKDLPSDQIKKLSSTLATQSNEKLREEKAADRGGRKQRPAASKAKLTASKDVGSRVDLTSYEDFADDDFM